MNGVKAAQEDLDQKNLDLEGSSLRRNRSEEHAGWVDHRAARVVWRL